MNNSTNFKVGDRVIVRETKETSKAYISFFYPWLNKEVEIIKITADTVRVKRPDDPDITYAALSLNFFHLELLKSKSPKMRLELYEDKINKKTYHRLVSIS